MSRRILVHCHEARHAAPGLELAAHQVAGGLGGHHRDIHVGRRRDLAEVDVEAVREEQGLAGGEAHGHALIIDGAHVLVGHEEHDDVRHASRLRHRTDVEARGLRPFPRSAAGAQAHHHPLARLLEVERVGMPLAAVADDGDLATLDDRQVRVGVVKHLNCHAKFSFSF